MEKSLLVNTDGGARGNPGPGACSFVARSGGKLIYKQAKYLGVTTNNQAEYQGVLLALLFLSKNPSGVKADNIIFTLDSELVGRQLSGRYKTKDVKLKSLLAHAKSLERKISARISYTVTTREKNKEADSLVNQELDRQAAGFTSLGK